MKPQMTPQAFSISQFCKQYGISRNMFYILERRGEAPITFRVGRRRLVSFEAAEKWRCKMEQNAAKHPTFEPPSSLDAEKED